VHKTLELGNLFYLSPHIISVWWVRATPQSLIFLLFIHSVMRFRPCIDLHSGEVKQIVGSSLTGDTSGSNEPSTNFVSSKPSSYYADLYKKVNLLGGHVIMLGSNEANVDAATAAIRAYPNALQVGGGMNDSNCLDWLGLGASKIIFTSFLFNGEYKLGLFVVL